MKLLELEIQNFKGISHKLKIEPNNKNFVVFGPNGSGKSTIVDSLDFLLTGNISRMTGAGTSGITINKYGKHIDSEPKDVIVRAIVQLNDISKPIELERSLNNRNELIYNHEYASYVEPLIEFASHGQHILTRREILNFVTAKPKDRSDKIEDLLKLENIKYLKEKLSKSKNKLKTEHQTDESDLDSTKNKIKKIIGIKEFDEELILSFINDNRSNLQGSPLRSIEYSNTKKDLEHPGTPKEGVVNLISVEENLDKLKKIISEEAQKEIFEIDLKLRDLRNKLNSDSELNKTINRLKIAKKGLELLEDDDSCPLCKKPWKNEELRSVLEIQIEDLNEVKEDLNQINDLTDDLIKKLSPLVTVLKQTITYVKLLDLENEKISLESWETKIRELITDLENENYPNDIYPTDQIKKFLIPDEIDELIDQIKKIAKEMSPEHSIEFESWDNLTKLELPMKELELKQIKFQNSLKSYQKSEILLKTFIKSRKSILDELYSEIKDRFVELYKELHGIDEELFEANLTQKDSGIEFSVGFYGRDIHPPNALHSEGHQDTMGICLYLALAEKITEEYINLIILDDVMMSVDADHRRKICRLLAKAFHNRQLFITTHDQTWKKQLQVEGVVTKKGVIELYDWNINTGPKIKGNTETWKAIDDDLKRNEVPIAAARLRRKSEEHFRFVCDALGAEIKFKNNGLYDLGDLLNSTIKRYKELLGKAKIVANSWENPEEIKYFKQVEKKAKEVFRIKDEENWSINLNVHYNEWADFTLADFKPVVESYKELYQLFECYDCGGVLHLSGKGQKAESLRCNCNNVNWNLIPK